MRSIVTVWIVVMGLISAGCGEGPSERQTPGGDITGPTSHEASDTPGMVRLEPEMLRDLRITTTTAQTREGREGVTVLGEVGVNEEAYAEVGSPVEARVMRLLASPGDSVKPGQPLMELQSMELGKTRAALITAKARVELTTQALERKRGLAAERIVPVRELQEAE